MPKIYQAFYTDTNGKFTRHNGASLTQVEKEARLTAQEKGQSVCVDVLEIEKPSLKLIIEMMNGRGAESRKPICVFRTTSSYSEEVEDGTQVQRWRVKKFDSRTP